MVLIDEKEYFHKVPMNRDNAEYNSALISYINLEVEIDDSQRLLKKYAETIKKLAKRD